MKELKKAMILQMIVNILIMNMIIPSNSSRATLQETNNTHQLQTLVREFFENMDDNEVDEFGHELMTLSGHRFITLRKLRHLAHPNHIIDAYLNEIRNLPSTELVVQHSLIFVENLIPKELWCTSIQEIKDPDSPINLYLLNFNDALSINTKEQAYALRSFQVSCDLYNGLRLQGISWNDQNKAEIVSIYHQLYHELFFLT